MKSVARVGKEEHFIKTTNSSTPRGRELRVLVFNQQDGRVLLETRGPGLGSAREDAGRVLALKVRL